MAKKNVCIICGGASSEHEVSLVSATSVIANLDIDKYCIHTIIIDKDGRWYYSHTAGPVENGAWKQHEGLSPAIISPDSACKGILKLLPNGRFERIPVDVVFPVLHGKNGEDGTLQGLLELAQIPYVGCDTLSSAVCMDKAVTHTLLDHAGIKTARWELVLSRELSDFDRIENKIATSLGYPVFVKPANAGSSVGVSKAKGKEELRQALSLAAQHDKKIVVEECIVGIEVECAVLGNENPIASIVGEVSPTAEFYDYEAKYVTGTTALYIPARIPAHMEKLVQETALQAYKVLGCSGLSRVDFFVRTNDVILNEINTLPGFTSISMYPKMLEASGIPYSELLDRLIMLAQERRVV